MNKLAKQVLDEYIFYLVYGHTKSNRYKIKNIYSKVIAKLGEYSYDYLYPMTSHEDIADFIVQINPFRHVHDFLFDSIHNTPLEQTIKNITEDLYDAYIKHGIDPMYMTNAQYRSVLPKIAYDMLNKIEKIYCDQHMRLFRSLFDKDIKKKINGLHMISSKNEHEMSSTISKWFNTIQPFICLGEEAILFPSMIHPQNKKMPKRTQFFTLCADIYNKTKYALLAHLSIFFNCYCCMILEMKDNTLIHLNLWKHHKYCNFSRKTILKIGERYDPNQYSHLDNMDCNDGSHLKDYDVVYDGNFKNFITKIQYYCDICQPLDINTYYASEGEE